MSHLEFINEILDSSTLSQSSDKRLKDVLFAIATRHHALVAIVWTPDGESHSPEIQLQLQNQNLPKLEFSEAEHSTLLSELSPGTATRLHSSVTEDNLWMLAMSAFATPSGPRILELMLPNVSDSEECARIALELEISTKLLGHLLIAVQPQTDVDTSRTYDAEFSALVHESVDFSKTAVAVANELRRALDVDRVTILKKKRSKWSIQAISGQVKVNTRSGHMRRLLALATRTLATGQSFHYPETAELLPQIADVLKTYLDHSETRSLAITPVIDRPKPHDQKQSENPNFVRAITFAGIVVENYKSVVDKSIFDQKFDGLFVDASSALQNAHRHSQLFLYPVWNFLGKSRLVVAARNLKTSVVILLSVLLLTAILLLWPADFNVISKGILVPVERQRVFAELDGIVVDVSADHQSKVSTGQRLVELVNEDLRFQIEQVDGEVLELRQRLNSMQAGRITTAGQTQASLETNVSGIRTQLEALERLKQTLQSKADRLIITSPISGEVITWDVKDRLLNRPVQPSELLIEVANVDGEWELLVNVPSRKIGHVLRANEALGELNVVYAIASEPGIWRKGQVVSIEQTARLQADQSQTVSLRVAIDLKRVKYPANTGIVAKIHCGRKSIGYVWAHDAWEYVQENIIFRIW